MNIQGDYSVTYNVSDAARNPAETVTRTVRVIAFIPQDYRIEAESFSLSNGYVIQNASSASNGQMINASNIGQENLATTLFNGVSGTYDMVIRYFDEDDGISTISLYVNDVLLENYTLFEDTNAWIERTIPEVVLQTEDEIKIVAVSRTGEFARVDYIDLLGIGALVPETIKPVISLLGDNPQILTVGDIYTENLELLRMTM